MKMGATKVTTIDAEKRYDMSAEEMRQMYTAYGTLWYHSTTERFPIEILEAMWAGCIPVAMTTDVIKDLVVQERTGVPIPYSDDLSTYKIATEQLHKEWTVAEFLRVTVKQFGMRFSQSSFAFRILPGLRITMRNVKINQLEEVLVMEKAVTTKADPEAEDIEMVVDSDPH